MHGRIVLASVLGVVLLAGSALAASRDAYMKWHQQRWPSTHDFRMEIVSDDEGQKAEAVSGQTAWIRVSDGERYSVRLHNPMPVRVAVGLTVDGLDSITGRSTTPARASKWVIEPHAYVDIRGWQVGGDTSRRFVFTRRSDSYAHWRRQREHMAEPRYGEISAACFWSSAELARALEPRPYVREGRGVGYSKAARTLAPAPEFMDRSEAGTGMGERLSHPIREVHFEIDAGMYSPGEALVVHYDLGAGPRPLVLEDRPVRERSVGFAPEMPERR